MSGPPEQEAAPATPSADFLSAASRVADRLCRDAVWAGNRCNWLGAALEPDGGTWTIVHRALGTYLYGGTSGIALFLAHCYRMTQEPLHRRTALGTLQQVLSSLDAGAYPGPLGFYDGVLGLSYALLQGGIILEQPTFVRRALQLVEHCTRRPVDASSLDVISGAAGAIPPLLAFYREYHHASFLDLAIRLGDLLVAQAVHEDHGWSWHTLPDPVERNLTGLAHGAAGIAWALLELSALTHLNRFATAAAQGFAYERHWFNTQQNNWPDFRRGPTGAPSNAATRYSMGWCHGAPGIGLTRLRAYTLTGDEAYRGEAEAALRTTMNALSTSSARDGINYSLCHGVTGNSELLIEANQQWGMEEFRTQAEQIGREGLGTYQQRRQPWPCGIPGAGETPNLMLGLAGIGYFYLRLYNATAIPSILLLSCTTA